MRTAGSSIASCAASPEPRAPARRPSAASAASLHAGGSSNAAAGGGRGLKRVNSTMYSSKWEPVGGGEEVREVGDRGRWGTGYPTRPLLGRLHRTTPHAPLSVHTPPPPPYPPPTREHVDPQHVEPQRPAVGRGVEGVGGGLVAVPLRQLLRVGRRSGVEWRGR